MKNLLAFGVTAVALSLGVAGAAQAQSISDEIGTQLGTTIDAASGQYLNMALNVARIDGSVDVTSMVEVDTTYYTDGTASIVDQDAGLGNLGDVATMAVGAINDGTVELGQQGSASAQSQTMSAALEDLEFGDDIDSQASNTSDAAVAAYQADFYASLGSGTMSMGSETSQSFYGPAEGAFAMNVAFNDVDLIDGSVSIAGNGASASAIGTTVAGAINTGVVTSGLTD